MSVKQVISSCFALIFWLFAVNSQASEFFDNQQKQSIGRYFKLNEMIVLSEGAASKGAITLGKDHRNGERFLKLQYAKAIQLDGKKRVQLFTIGYTSKHQVSTSATGCRSSKQQASPFQHPQLGGFIICASLSGTNKKLISATVLPTANNRTTQLQIDYSGTANDLVILLKALRAYS